MVHGEITELLLDFALQYVVHLSFTVLGSRLTQYSIHYFNNQDDLNKKLLAAPQGKISLYLPNSRFIYHPVLCCRTILLLQSGEKQCQLK